MKIQLNRETLIKLCGILLLLAILPFAVELFFLIDVFGFEFTVSFLFLYLGAIRDRVLVKIQEIKHQALSFVFFIASLYMFQPRVFISHSVASGVVVTLTCSALLATVFWLPAIYLSSGFV